jgi:hypothetical protein
VQRLIRVIQKNLIQLVQKIIAKTFLSRVVRPPIHSLGGHWLASDGIDSLLILLLVQTYYFIR